MESPIGPSGDVGIVLVHGIGEQQRGRTLEKFLRGLAASVPTAVVTTHRGGGAVVSVGGCVLRVYEAWWADVLEPEVVERSFDEFTITEVTWLPWFNHRHHLYPESQRVKVFLWTAVLRPLLAFLPFLLLLMNVVYWGLARVLATVVGDVTNYANSAGRAMPEDGPLSDASDRVLQRFATALEVARQDGCVRIVVVGHSLGSVVAYHGLTGQVHQDPDQREQFEKSYAARQLVSNLITIGSPLEKIRFFWPLLTASDRQLVPGGVRWDNIRDRLDLVSGRLRHRNSFGPVHDHALVGRAWLLTAHTAYERNPYFMRLLLQRAGVAQAEVKRTKAAVRVGLALTSVALSFATLTLLIVPIVVTFAVIGVACVVMAGFIAIRTSVIAADGGSGSYERALSASFHWGLWLAPLAVLLGSLLMGLDEAMTRHWAIRHRRWPSPANLAPTSSPGLADASGDISSSAE